MNEKILKFVNESEELLKSQFDKIDKIALFNQYKVLNAFRDLKISERHFSGTTGYGYDDVGRDTLAQMFARVFGGENAIVSPLITCGSHTIAISLFGL
ncbi:MAG: methionine gamma-lyase family protein, partial [Clostridia bacterium]